MGLTNEIVLLMVSFCSIVLVIGMTLYCCSSKLLKRNCENQSDVEIGVPEESEDLDSSDESTQSLPEVELRYMEYIKGDSGSDEDDPGDNEKDFGGNEDDCGGNEDDSGDKEDKNCIDCAILYISEHMSDLFSKPFSFDKKFDCTFQCLQYENCLETFAMAFSSHLALKNSLNRKNEEIFMSNIILLFDKIISLRNNGRIQLFCFLLVQLDVLEYDERDKLVTIINKISSRFVDFEHRKFEEEFKGAFGANARKSLLRYMANTSHFLALQSVVEFLLVFFKTGIHVDAFLPSDFNLEKRFENIPEDQASIEYHKNISNITRSLIQNIFKEKAIEIIKLETEEFINKDIPAGNDLFLYFNKRGKVFYHLVVFPHSIVYMEEIELATICFDTENRIFSNKQWKFVLKNNFVFSKALNELFVEEKSSKLSTEIEIVNEVDKKKQATHSKDKLKTEMMDDFHRMVEEDDANSSMDDEDISDDHKVKSKAEMINDSPRSVKEEDKGSDIDDGDLSNDNSDMADDDCIQAVINDGFSVKKEDLINYWNPAMHGSGRKFIRETTGRDWPMMYGSPCAVVIGYDHVKAIDSRKRNLPFAKLSGECLICKATHRFKIQTNPFKETYNKDGTIKYQSEENMIVFVTVEGRFHLKHDSSTPDITKPVHDRTNSKGLQLRGDERRLLAMKGSLEGASSVYYEGMAYIQREQIESHNRTGLRSLPVVR